jgi:hypothetical protein
MPRLGKVPLKDVFMRLMPISSPTSQLYITKGFKTPYWWMIKHEIFIKFLCHWTTVHMLLSSQHQIPFSCCYQRTFVPQKAEPAT